MGCGVGGRRSLDLVLLWLWCTLAAVALIRGLAWEPPYAVGVALKEKKKKKKIKPPKNKEMGSSPFLGEKCSVSRNN